MDQICHVCKKTKVKAIQVYNKNRQPIDSYYISCSYCGNYQITPEVVNLKILEKHSDDLYRLSAAIFKKSKQNEVIELTIKSVPEIINSTIRKSPWGIIDEMMEYVGNKAFSITDEIKLGTSELPRFVLKDERELFVLIEEIEKLGFWSAIQEAGKSYAEVRLTLKGWERIDTKINRSNPNQAFVAMSFDPSMDQIYQEGIKPALEATQFKKIIMVKEVQHNDKIDDLIIANIRKSGLVIVDVTGNRSAVYFEAGFAKGLNIDVIWLCKETNTDDFCFDTQQYNHILWKDADDLKGKLINRIAATIPGHLPK
ncbi:MAG: hypothetical protein MUP71_11615 [Candidatus Aminicenantes bacterium]|nr:hypothetical protein [Candidatus Aminicenantes bacterium]